MGELWIWCKSMVTLYYQIVKKDGKKEEQKLYKNTKKSTITIAQKTPKQQ